MRARWDKAAGALAQRMFWHRWHIWRQPYVQKISDFLNYSIANVMKGGAALQSNAVKHTALIK